MAISADINDDERAENLDHIGKTVMGIKALMLPEAVYIAAKREWPRAAYERSEFVTWRKFGIELETFLLFAT